MFNQSLMVRVPATAGSFAGATNCAALALDAALNVKVTPRTDDQVAIRYFGKDGERVPRDRSNLIVRAMESALRVRGLEFTGADFEIYSSVPVAVGLGSSTAAILAGLIAADQLFRLDLDDKTLFGLAGICEDRRDNLRAAWLGGFIACAEEGTGVAFRRTPVPEDFTLHVVVPETTLVMGARRADSSPGVVPSESRNAMSRANAIGDFFAHPGIRRGVGIEEPLPPTCEKNIAGLEEAMKVRVPGVLSVFVCGSGPAVGILAQENAGLAVAAVRECFARHGVGSLATLFHPSNGGARDWNAVLPQIAPPPPRGRSSAGVKSSSLPA